MVGQGDKFGRTTVFKIFIVLQYRSIKNSFFFERSRTVSDTFTIIFGVLVRFKTWDNAREPLRTSKNVSENVRKNTSCERPIFWYFHLLILLAPVYYYINLFFDNKRHCSTKKGIRYSICMSFDANSCENIFRLHFGRLSYFRINTTQPS
jgi:hypothetical protein